MRLHQTHWTDPPMPADSKYQLHAFTRRVDSSWGLTFTENHIDNLDELFTDADEESTYNPTDDELSYESDEDYDYVPNDDPSDDENTVIHDNIHVETAGVLNVTNNNSSDNGNNGNVNNTR